MVFPLCIHNLSFSYRYIVLISTVYAGTSASIRFISEAMQHNTGLLSECLLPGIGQKILSTAKALITCIPNNIRTGLLAFLLAHIVHSAPSLLRYNCGYEIKSLLI